MVIELTPFEFNWIDFSEAVIIKTPFRDHTALIVSCWGITILSKDLKNNKYRFWEFDNGCDIYVAGKCEIIFENIMDYRYEFYDKFRSVIYSDYYSCIDTYESYVNMHDSYAVYKILDVNACHGLLSSSIDKWMDLEVKSTAVVKIVCDDLNFTNVTEYCKTPYKYIYRE